MKKATNLLYIKEHLGCEHYIKENNVGFTKYNFEKDNTHYISLDKEFAVIFVLSGRFLIELSDKKKMVIAKNEICLLSNFMKYEILAKSDAKVTIMYFDRPNSRCDLLALDKMADDKVNSDRDKIKKIVMKKPVLDFIKNMEFYLDKLMYCRHLHDIKETEFFFLVRGFYTIEEIKCFFAPVIRSLNDFTNLVHANYLKVSKVSEL